MARRRPDTRQATETLQEIEGVFDRLANRIAANPVPWIVLLAAVLVGAAGVSVYRWYETQTASEASRAVAEVESAYLDAMGAEPGATQVPEPEDPEKARAARERYAERFAEVAEAHAGTAAAVSARLQAGRLFEALGDTEAAVASWRKAAEGAEEGTGLEALARVQLGRGLEQMERWSDAAEQHERAGRVEAYPARAYALADAARCWANAGQTDRALAVFEEAESAASGTELPTYIAARMRELRAAR